MKERLAVICTKNPTNILLETIEAVKKFYPEFDIVIIDSDSANLSVFSQVPADCIIEYAKNQNWELGAWVYAFNKYNQYKVYMFIQDTLNPIARIPDLDSIKFTNGVLYSWQYRSRLGKAGYMTELGNVYRNSDLSFISQINPNVFITGTGHTSFITNHENVNTILQLENAYIAKNLKKTKVDSWLSERTGGIMADKHKNIRKNMIPYFIKRHGNRTK